MSFLRSAFLVACGPALLVAAAFAPAARAETLTCTELATLPATITASGHYCLSKNFSQVFTTAAINIAASNVVLDCNDHAVTQTGTTAITGVYASNRSQVTVRNCALNGFGRGIAFFETAAGQSRANRVLGNVIRRSRVAGIQMAGTANQVADNHVSENMGSAASQYTYGILLSSFGDNGVGNVLRRNVIADFVPDVYVRPMGIYLMDVDGTAVLDNTISSLYSPQGQGAYGIVASGTVLNTAAVRNHVITAVGTPSPATITFGGPSYDGLRFDAAPTAVDHNACRDNVVGHWLNNIATETAGGGCVKFDNTEF
jgi:hypothetical protein